MARRRRGEKFSESLYYPLQATQGRTFNNIGLRRKLVGVVAKLGPLAEQHGLMKFLNNADHVGVLNGFVRDLTDAIADYQV